MRGRGRGRGRGHGRGRGRWHYRDWDAQNDSMTSSCPDPDDKTPEKLDKPSTVSTELKKEKPEDNLVSNSAEDKPRELKGDPLALVLNSDKDSTEDSGDEEVKAGSLLNTTTEAQLPGALGSLASMYADSSDSEDNAPTEMPASSVKTTDETKGSVTSSTDVSSQELIPRQVEEKPKHDKLPVEQQQGTKLWGSNRQKRVFPRKRRGRKGRRQGKPSDGSMRKPSLLEMLLANDIRHERNVILQCVRYIVKKNFFDIEQNSQVKEEKPVIVNGACVNNNLPCGSTSTDGSSTGYIPM